MKFSQRMGYTSEVKQIQFESIDNELKNRLWNIFRYYFMDSSWFLRKNTLPKIEGSYRLELLGFSLCDKLFKDKIDDFPSIEEYQKVYISSWYFSKLRNWYEIYDFLEFVLKFAASFINKKGLKIIQDEFNEILQQEFSGYRFINEDICPITSEAEISSIEETLSKTDSGILQPVNIHFKTALQYLSNKKNPDYRNSIKESISAVESVCKIINGNKGGELKDALNKLKTKINIHGAMESGFKSLYGYTSDSSGIRHGLTDLPDVDFDDAKYMLVSCSSFVNYLISKASKNGLISN